MSNPPNLIGSLRALAATSLGVVRTRLELIAIELAEEKSRLMGMVMLALAGLLCLTLGLMMLSFLVVVLFWDTEYRLYAITLVGVLYLLIGVVLLLMVRKRAVSAPIAFEETLAELERDRAMLAAASEGGASRRGMP